MIFTLCLSMHMIDLYVYYYVIDFITNVDDFIFHEDDLHIFIIIELIILFHMTIFDLSSYLNNNIVIAYNASLVWTNDDIYIIFYCLCRHLFLFVYWRLQRRYTWLSCAVNTLPMRNLFSDCFLSSIVFDIEDIKK